MSQTPVIAGTRQQMAFIATQPLSRSGFCVSRPTSTSLKQQRSKLLPTVPKPVQRCIGIQRRQVIQNALALPAPIQLPTATAAALGAAKIAATPFTLWAVLLTGATLGLVSQKYKWGQALTPPLIATLFTLFLSNFELMPATHPIYSSVMTFIVPLSIPLILLGADLRRVVSQTGRLLPVFIVGSIATCVGTIAAWYLVPIKSIGVSAAWKIAAALAARHIGGAVNYVAVADATGAPADIVTAALTADNVVVAVYFVLLLLLARNVSQPSDNPIETTTTEEQPGLNIVKENNNDSDEQTGGPIDVKDAAIALSLSAVLCTVAAFINALLPFRLGVIPVVTALIVIVATAVPQQLRPYRKAASTLGIFFLQIFFAVAGAGGSLLSVVRRAPVLLVFSTIQILVHLAFLMLVGRIFRFHKSHILISSNANVGGPATAAAMARSKSWDTLVLPALLVGVFGYSIATFVSLGLGAGVLRFL